MADLNLEQLQQNPSLFPLLVESVRDYAIFALDAEGRIVSWNRGAEQIKGYPAQEAIGRNYSDFFTAEDRAAGRPEMLLRRAREEGRAEDEGWRLRRDGSRFWANAVLTPLRTTDGQVAGFAKVTRDLTERRAAELALRKRERQLADTQGLAGLGSWEWDAVNDRVTWTDELYRIYGLSPRSFAATFQAYLERVHPEDRERVSKLIEEAFRTGSEFEFEERILRPDGEERVLRSRGRTIQDDVGRTVQLVGACLDVTELKRAERQAVNLAREQSAREAAESMIGGLKLLVEASEILASSLDYRRTLGNVARLAVPALADWCAIDLLQDDGSLKRAAVVHLDPAKMALADEYARRFPPEPESDRGAWRVVRTGEPQYFPEIPEELLATLVSDSEQLEMLKALGLRSAATVPLTGRTGPLGALTLVQAESGRRISESDLWLARQLGRNAALAIENARLHRDLEEQNRQLEEVSVELELQAEELQAQAGHQEELMERLERTNEELLQRTDEAEQANRAKSEFLAAMSHELRTPLNAIFGYADLLQLGIHGGVTPAQHEALERIKRNQRALLVLVNDVLNFAKLEAGRLEIVFDDVSISEVIGDLEKIVGPQLRAKGLEYVCAPCGSDVRVRGERERVEQILLNLLTNAIKYTDSGGKISIDVEADGSLIGVRVSDTGRGIPEDRLQAIFDPFVQIDRRPGETEDRGVGLGLAISRDLAVAMNGELSVTSTPGEGSTFTLTLPRTGGE